MLNANDRVHSLEDELRNIASKTAKLENDHHKVIQELNVGHIFKDVFHENREAALIITV